MNMPLVAHIVATMPPYRYLEIHICNSYLQEWTQVVQFVYVLCLLVVSGTPTKRKG